ncbi:MAG: DUF2283 domain-containing protein [Anaerolineae bacterium]|nr:DUF2283 domain-containing protein [Anaerolineae bacterium]
MKIEFDPIADALYLELTDSDIEKTEEIKPGVMIDYDADGNIVGVEVLYISKREHQQIKKAA